MRAAKRPAHSGYLPSKPRMAYILQPCHPLLAHRPWIRASAPPHPARHVPLQHRLQQLAQGGCALQGAGAPGPAGGPARMTCATESGLHSHVFVHPRAPHSSRACSCTAGRAMHWLALAGTATTAQAPTTPTAVPPAPHATAAPPCCATAAWPRPRQAAVRPGCGCTMQCRCTPGAPQCGTTQQRAAMCEASSKSWRSTPRRLPRWTPLQPASAEGARVVMHASSPITAAAPFGPTFHFNAWQVAERYIAAANFILDSFFTFHFAFQDCSVSPFLMLFYCLA